MNLQTLLESANPWRDQQAEAGRLASKWAKSGLLEGLKTDIDRNAMALMLENQAKQLISEASATGTGATFTAGTGEQWAGVALPLVRRVFAEIAAKDFVSVQPMNLPSGLIFYLDFKYGNNRAPFAQNESVYGATSDLFSTDTTKGLYGVGKFGYSINQFSASSGDITLGTTGITSSAVNVSWAELNFDSAYSASVAAGSITRVLIPSSQISNYDSGSIRSFIITSGSSVTAANALPAFTYLDSSNRLVFYLTGSMAGLNIKATSAFTVFYNRNTADNRRGDFEEGSANAFPNVDSNTTISIPEINVQLKSEPIVAKTRKLKAQWTPEFAQDLKAYQSIDAEAELTSMLSEYISMEVDLEILEMLIENVPTGLTEYWSAQSNYFINASKTGFDAAQAGAGGFYNTQGQWFQTLGTKVQKISNEIHRRTLRGGANFMVVSPTVATILESIPGYAADTDGDKMNFAMGVQKVGQLNSRFKVYKNPYMTENLILMGFRGSQFLETGAVYAPYIPLIMTPLVYDPNTFTPRKGIMTRYAKKMVRPEFYGKIYVSGLNTI